MNEFASLKKISAVTPTPKILRMLNKFWWKMLETRNMDSECITADDLTETVVSNTNNIFLNR